MGRLENLVLLRIGHTAYGVLGEGGPSLSILRRYRVAPFVKEEGLGVVLFAGLYIVLIVGQSRTTVGIIDGCTHAGRAVIALCYGYNTAGLARCQGVIAIRDFVAIDIRCSGQEVLAGITEGGCIFIFVSNGCQIPTGTIVESDGHNSWACAGNFRSIIGDFIQQAAAFIGKDVIAICSVCNLGNPVSRGIVVDCDLTFFKLVVDLFNKISNLVNLHQKAPKTIGFRCYFLVLGTLRQLFSVHLLSVSQAC